MDRLHRPLRFGSMRRSTLIAAAVACTLTPMAWSPAWAQSGTPSGTQSASSPAAAVAPRVVNVPSPAPAVAATPGAKAAPVAASAAPVAPLGTAAATALANAPTAASAATPAASEAQAASAASSAAEGAASASVEPRDPALLTPSPASSLTQLALSFLGVAAALLGMAWLVRWRRQQSSPTADGPAFQVVSSLALGGRDRLHLVQVAQQFFVVGHTPSQITFLTEVKPAPQEPSTSSQPPSWNEAQDSMNAFFKQVEQTRT